MDYDGPAYNKKNNRETKERRFTRSGQKRGGEKFEFKPAFLSQSSSSDQSDTKATKRQKDEKSNESLQFPTEKEEYEVPFLKYNKPTKALRSEEVEKQDVKKTKQQVEEEQLVNTETSYPQEQTEPTFQPTVLPKPYDPDANTSKVDKNIRTLSKRLVKDKRSFLLFD